MEHKIVFMIILFTLKPHKTKTQTVFCSIYSLSLVSKIPNLCMQFPLLYFAQDLNKELEWKNIFEDPIM